MPVLRRVLCVLLPGLLVVSAARAQKLCAQSASGPFGLHMGMTKAELERVAGPLERMKTGLYKATHVPKPHERFETYYLVMSPSFGLCQIWVTGVSIKTSGFGTQLHEEFETIKAAMASKYGAPTINLDGVPEGSLWTEPQYWMMGLLQHDRTLKAAWENLGGDLEVIFLDTTALSTDEGWLKLSYHFKNSDKCVDELRKTTNEAF